MQENSATMAGAGPAPRHLHAGKLRKRLTRPLPGALPGYTTSLACFSLLLWLWLVSVSSSHDTSNSKSNGKYLLVCQLLRALLCLSSSLLYHNKHVIQGKQGCRKQHVASVAGHTGQQQAPSAPVKQGSMQGTQQQLAKHSIGMVYVSTRSKYKRQRRGSSPTHKTSKDSDGVDPCWKINNDVFSCSISAIRPRFFG